MNWTDLLFPAALVALGLPLLLGLRNRILVSMAFRNALRRKRQSAMIAAGLMVGTAIVAGAQVASDSMEYSIGKATYDAFEEIDETVFLDGYNFFPQTVEDRLAANQVLRGATDAIGSNIIWDGAVTNQRTDLYEPSVRVVGFDPDEEPQWGPFRAGSDEVDGKDLGPNDVILNEDAAEKIEAREGDKLTINYTLPQDPLIPDLRNFTGSITGSATVPTLPGVPPGTVPQSVEASSFTRQFPVEAGATRLNILLAWNPGAPAAQDLDLYVRSPAGRTWSNTNGTTNAPDIPAFLFLNQTIAQPLEVGDWTLTVRAKAATQVSFRGTIATFYAVYDLTEFEARAAALERAFPGFSVEEFGEPPRHAVEVTVAHIVAGGKGPNFQLPNTLTLYMRLDALQGLLDRRGQVNFVKVSNPGGVVDGAEATDDVYPVLWGQLNETKKEFPTDPSIQNLRANNDKQFWIEQAEEVGRLFAVFLTFVGSFSVIAGLLLIINIFTMLAEERKVELAMARAVGLRRGQLVRLFTFEGIYYAVPAAVVGTFFGLGLAAVLIAGFNAFSGRGFLPPIPFRVEAGSLLFAFSLGILLTVGTVYLGARRASRLNIVAAIRNLDEPPIIRGWSTLVGTALVAAAGVAGTWFAIVAESFAWQLLGPTFLTIGLAFILRRFLEKRYVYPTLALALFIYLVFTLFFIEDPDTTEAEVFGPVRAVIMALSVVVWVVYTERLAKLLGRLLARLRSLRPVALPAVSYPLHKKFRTGMTLAMFSVILLVVMLFSIFGALFAPDIEKESGGYDVEGKSNLSFATLEGRGSDASVLDEVESYDVIPFFLRYGNDIVRVDNRSTGQFGPPQNVVYGVDEAFARNNGFTLLERDRRFASDEEAYAAVARDPSLVIVSYQYSTDENNRDGAFGTEHNLQLVTKGQVKEFDIVGVQEQFHFWGIFISKDLQQSLFPNSDTLVLFHLKDPTQDEAMAKRIESGYRDLGLDANSIRIQVLEENQAFQQIFTLIRLFLSLGLIVGILSLGIVTARSVIERRQEIGMMRALGFLRRHIRRTFLVELVTTITMGILIGTGVALIVSYAIWYSQLRELRLPYIVPWVELLVIALIAYTVTILATLGPIFRAARIPPAEALRYIE